MNNRLQRLYFFLVVWFTMISCGAAWGQNSSVVKSKTDFLNLHFTAETSIRQYAVPAIHENPMVFPGPAGLRGISNDDKHNTVIERAWHMDGFYVQPANLYYTQSGFFCKREWEFEKTTHIPFRFRLGSLADCNAMEGKH